LPELRGKGGRGAGRAGPGTLAIAWLWVGLWLLVVLQFSQGAFSAEWSRRGIGPLILILGLTREQADLVHFFIRKGAHVLEYAVLAFLAFRATGLSLERGRAAACAFLLCAAVASLDEANQATKATRSGTPRDVALDLAGAALGLVVRQQVDSALRAHAAPEAA
jgi:VanZ family protein